MTEYNSGGINAAPFTYSAGLAAGLTPGQLRSRGLQHPFRGVRARGLDLGLTRDRCLAYATRMSPDAAFSHVTSAQLWGLPLPLGVPRDVHVTVPVPHRAPRVHGVIGHRRQFLADEKVSLDGLPLFSPSATWAQLGETLSIEDLIAVGEHIITGNPYEKRLPLATISQLRRAADLRTHGSGHRARMSAMREMREGAFSRPETFTRLLVTRCGLPSPLINADVLGVRGEFIAMPDLHWTRYRVALEYQGDHHRRSRQFRDDIARLERLIDADWLVVQVTAAELFDNPALIVERVARRLASRGWTGPIDLRRLVTFQR